LKCPVCGGAGIGTVDSRRIGDKYRQRRRRCSDCYHRFSTFEISADEYWALKSVEREQARARREASGSGIDLKKLRAALVRVNDLVADAEKKIGGGRQ